MSWLKRSFFSLSDSRTEKGRAWKGKNINYIGDGMSEQFRPFITDLVRKYGFSHPVEAGSKFDT
jgi:hypothetical protein